MEWKTIDSAPKDGTSILAYCPESGEDQSGNVVIVHYDQSPGEPAIWGESTGEQWATYTPSHWMPLPEPPTALKDKGA